MTATNEVEKGSKPSIDLINSSLIPENYSRNQDNYVDLSSVLSEIRSKIQSKDAKFSDLVPVVDINAKAIMLPNSILSRTSFFFYIIGELAQILNYSVIAIEDQEQNKIEAMSDIQENVCIGFAGYFRSPTDMRVNRKHGEMKPRAFGRHLAHAYLVKAICTQRSLHRFLVPDAFVLNNVDQTKKKDKIKSLIGKIDEVLPTTDLKPHLLKVLQTLIHQFALSLNEDQVQSIMLPYIMSVSRYVSKYCSYTRTEERVVGKSKKTQQFKVSYIPRLPRSSNMMLKEESELVYSSLKHLFTLPTEAEDFEKKVLHLKDRLSFAKQFDIDVSENFKLRQRALLLYAKLTTGRLVEIRAISGQSALAKKDVQRNMLVTSLAARKMPGIKLAAELFQLGIRGGLMENRTFDTLDQITGSKDRSQLNRAIIASFYEGQNDWKLVLERKKTLTSDEKKRAHDFLITEHNESQKRESELNQKKLNSLKQKIISNISDWIDLVKIRGLTPYSKAIREQKSVENISSRFIMFTAAEQIESFTQNEEIIDFFKEDSTIEAIERISKTSQIGQDWNDAWADAIDGE